MEIIQAIQNRIYEVRGQRVMLDRDLAILYSVELRSLNQAVKRNHSRFPDDFMFQLTKEEYDNFLLAEENMLGSRSQIVILNNKRGQNLKYLPFVFTEQGIAMLSSVLRSEKAITMNIAIMRAFIHIRKTLSGNLDLREQINLIKERIGEHDAQLNQIYDAMENLLDEKAAQKKWSERTRIGFKS
jgi:hypothetical protein